MLGKHFVLVAEKQYTRLLLRFLKESKKNDAFDQSLGPLLMRPIKSRFTMKTASSGK